MSSQLMNRRVLLTSRPKGVPVADHFTVEESAVPEIGDREFLVKTEYWSIDPAMRGWSSVFIKMIAPINCLTARTVRSTLH